MRYVKIAPNVANVTCGRKTLEDKEAVYPETMWRPLILEELIKRKFLVFTESHDRVIHDPGTAAAPKMIKKKLIKADFKANPDLYKQGLRPGDEIEIPDPDAGGEEEEEQ